MQGTSPQPLLSRIEAIRARRDNPTPRIVQLYPSEPTRLSPWVRRAKEGRLTPRLLNGAYTPAGSERGA